MPGGGSWDEHSTGGMDGQEVRAAHVCGIVGLFLKDKALEPELGRLTAAMLHEMCDRGPDSAGFAVYGAGAGGASKICAVRRSAALDWDDVAVRLAAATGSKITFETIEDHAILRIEGDGETARNWLIDNVPEATVLSQGQSIEILQGRRRSRHHRRAAATRLVHAARTPSATRAWRRKARSRSPARIRSRPAATPASCTTARCPTTTACARRCAATASDSRPRTTPRSPPATCRGACAKATRSKQALEHALDDLDGFYTFVVGTRDGFAVLRDPVACKPAVMAETDDWVALRLGVPRARGAPRHRRRAHLGAGAGDRLRLEPELSMAPAMDGARTASRWRATPASTSRS